jgi:carbonic anhydrase
MTIDNVVSRRAFLRWAGLAASGAALMACTRTVKGANGVPTAEGGGEGTPAAEGTHVASEATPTLRPQEKMESSEALIRLLDGNERYVKFHLEHPDVSEERRGQVAQGQTPFAAIVGCADSRVPPEILFDQGLGDLFVVRVAGNIVDSALLGSLEYAVEHLGVRLVMVLGHEKCGAVKATIDTLDSGTPAPGSINTLVEAIRPAVEVARGLDGDLLDNAIIANVILTMNQTKATSVILSNAIRAGELLVVGGRYDLDTGAVRLLSG